MSSRRLVAALVLAVLAGTLAGAWDQIDPVVRGILVGVIALGVVLVVLREQKHPNDDTELLGILETVLADETRRPWNPTTVPWLPTGESPKPVLLIPAADYHLAEMCRLPVS